MQTGKILAWNNETLRGLVEDSLSGFVYRFNYGHKQDRSGFREGLRVTFDVVPAWTSPNAVCDRFMAVEVEAASGSFRRFANQYTPE